MRVLQQRVEELEASLARAEGRVPDEPECPTGFEENRGHVPDFYIKVDGVRLQACYVRRLPGTGMVEGTLGGPDDPVFLHELYVLPSIVSETNPFPIPAWFIQSISANATAFPSVMAEAVKIGDWGLEAELERYHRVDTRLAHVQADIAELQAEADGLRTEKHACHYRLARADVGERLAALEAAHPAFQGGELEDFPSRRKSQRRLPFK
jgi:hypothetical protein